MINTKESRKVLFRLNNTMKTDFSLALVQNGVAAQNILEAVVERIIAFHNSAVQPGEKKLIAALFKRAKELQADTKLCV